MRTASRFDEGCEVKSVISIPVEAHVGDRRSHSGIPVASFYRGRVPELLFRRSCVCMRNPTGCSQLSRSPLLPDHGCWPESRRSERPSGAQASRYVFHHLSRKVSNQGLQIAASNERVLRQHPSLHCEHALGETLLPAQNNPIYALL